MRYLMFMIPAAHGMDATADLPSVEMIDTMMKYNAQLADAGILESLNGLHPPSLGVRLTFGGESPQVGGVDPEGAVGGYWILNVETHEAAVEWARRCPAQPGDILELRRIQEIEDFPNDVQDVLGGYDL